MAVPTFIVVGAQKSGTTWVFECLKEHPEVFVPEFKEVHFFDRTEDSRFSRRDKGLSWYLSLFPSDAGYTALGEVTPDYMYYPHVAEELWMLNADMKIIFLLRNPIDRAYSAYWMQRRHKATMPEFREVLLSHPGYVSRGLYYRQIARFLERFSPEQLRVHIYEEATADPEAFVADLYAFIGVTPNFKPATLHRSVGATRNLPLFAGFLLYKVISPLINHPVILPMWRQLRRLIPGGTKGRAYPRMDPADRVWLAEQFHEENAKLSAFLGRDIAIWRT